MSLDFKLGIITTRLKGHDQHNYAPNIPIYIVLRYVIGCVLPFFSFLDTKSMNFDHHSSCGYSEMKNQVDFAKSTLNSEINS